jgi:hypothetical protein
MTITRELALLEQTGEPLSRQLFYDPGIDWYVLDIHRAGKRRTHGTAN